MKIRFLAILATIFLIVPAAHAGPFFLGASFGQTDLEHDRKGLNFNDRDTGWKVFGGFRFLRFFGLEGGYRDFGNPATTLGGQGARYSVEGWDAYAVGVLPIRKLELFAKAGLIYWDLRSSTVGGPAGPEDDQEDGVNVAWGAGAAWRFTDYFALRGEYEVFDLDSVDSMEFISIGVDFRF